MVRSQSEIKNTEIYWQEGDVMTEAVEIKQYVGKVKKGNKALNEWQ